MIKNEPTICAIATPLGNAGVSIVRMSGSEALVIAKKVFFTKKQTQFSPRHMYLGEIRDDNRLLDEALGVYFEAPASYTGEDSFELHCHGGQTVTRMVLEALIKHGATPAEPGEFTKRAFVNGKMDLSMAEAVADQISALSENGVRIAAQQMQGELYQAVVTLQDDLTDLLAEVEAGVEYPEEDLEAEIVGDTLPRLRVLQATFGTLKKSFRQGKLLREGIRVALVGNANVGKSSLLNAIFGEERAIVSEIPGTTRDVIQEYYVMHGTPLLFIDTAGMRETEDVIEQMGVARSEKALKEASVIVLVIDGAEPLREEDKKAFALAKEEGKEIVLVKNKIDLAEKVTKAEIEEAFGQAPLELSAQTKEGVDSLMETIYEKAMGAETLLEGIVIVNERHAYALTQAEAALAEAIFAMETGVDLDCVTIDLNIAWRALGEITGETLSEEIIDRIFERFCLGK
ncbi:MAG: tRNA uridine-5-carboxymethylaminomethyl(34) synthesis GTPase MnmE [Christensenellaceae bacterium]|jgi:tRNA modification GTPase